MKNRLFKKCEESKVFRDPIHSYIHIEYQIIYDLISCPSFQRLRRIKQLGATHIVYPTAEHSRFSHSLGVYEISRRMVSENEHIKGALSEEEMLYVMIAALLHDIGHGPYSHVFERITEISHENTGFELLLSDDSDIHQVLESYEDGLSHIIASIINHSYPKKLCWQLISSQLDADRMDYLLRDAYFTGTKYGEFDLERILRTLRVKDKSLVVKQSGIYAVEDYLMARFHMFWQVYYHINIRIFEQMFVSLIERIVDLKISDEYYLNGLDRLIKPEHIDLNLFLSFDDGSINEIFKRLSKHEDKIVKDLARRLLDRDLFKEYVDNEENYHLLKAKLINNNLDPRYYLLKDSHKFNATRPYISTGKQKINILLSDKKTIKEFTEVSSIMKSLSKANDSHESFLFTPDLI